MNILILNWRAPFHPFAGGAEKITEKYANYWISLGHSVYWLTNSQKESTSYKSKIKFISMGPSLIGNVLFLLIKYPIFLISSVLTARQVIKEKGIDTVIDEIHGLPFFSPIFSKRRNILLVCEVADSIWDKMFPFPINKLGKQVEKLIYLVYASSEIWAISKNTAADIVKYCSKCHPKVIPLGIDKPNIRPQSKVHGLSLIFLARLVKMKGVEVAIHALSEIIKKKPETQLNIVGSGSPQYTQKLLNLVKHLNISNNVNFFGKISESDKYRLLSRSHFLLHPSYKEGFGLTVLEAGIVGTPSIVRAGGSLGELVKNNETGLCFSNESGICSLILNNYTGKKYQLLSNGAKANARNFLWDQQLKNSTKITGI